MRGPGDPGQGGMDPEVWTALEHFRDGVLAVLGTDVVAIYADGSLTLGDFEPATSDLDVLVVTRAPLDAAPVEQLARLHARLTRDLRWGGRLEGEYAALHQLCPAGIIGPVVAIVAGGELHAGVPSAFTAENGRAMRDHSIVLHGVPPSSVLPVVDDAAFTTALRSYFAELVRGAPEVAADLVALADTLLNAARCLLGLRIGRPCTKTEAALWLGEQRPELAAALATARAVRRGERPPDGVDVMREGLRRLAGLSGELESLP